MDKTLDRIKRRVIGTSDPEEILEYIRDDRAQLINGILEEIKLKGDERVKINKANELLTKIEKQAKEQLLSKKSKSSSRLLEIDERLRLKREKYAAIIEKQHFITDNIKADISRKIEIEGTYLLTANDAVPQYMVILPRDLSDIYDIYRSEFINLGMYHYILLRDKNTGVELALGIEESVNEYDKSIHVSRYVYDLFNVINITNIEVQVIPSSVSLELSGGPLIRTIAIYGRHLSPQENEIFGQEIMMRSRGAVYVGQDFEYDGQQIQIIGLRDIDDNIVSHGFVVAPNMENELEILTSQ